MSTLAGVTYDETVAVRALGYGLRPGRSRLQLILEGHGELRMGDRVRSIRPGTLIALPDLQMATVRNDGPSRVLEIDWKPGTIAPAIDSPSVVDGRLPSGLRDAVDALMGGTQPDGEALLCSILDRIRAGGLPFERLVPGDLVDPLAHRFAPLCRAMDASLSNLQSGPMSIDLEHGLDRSRRGVVRLIDAFAVRYGVTGVSSKSASKAERGSNGWRAMRDFWRLAVGFTMMTVESAQTSAVARVLGYGSAEAFCHAFANVGLPSPGKVRRALAIAS